MRRKIACLSAAVLLLAGCAAANRAPREALRALETETRLISGEKLLAVPAGFAPPAPYTVARTAPEVLFAAYAFPHDQGTPWSHWGTGLVHSNGRVYTAVGDHRCIGATTLIYEFDPRTNRLRAVADIFPAVEGFDPEKHYGFGKIHGRLSEGRDGNIYCAGGWGSSRNRDRYKGSHLFRFEPRTGVLTDLGRPLFGWDFPTTDFYREGMLFYAEATLPPSHRGGDPEKNYRDQFNEALGRVWRFAAYDIERGRVVYLGGKEESGYGRCFFVDGAGRAYFNNGENRLQMYCPEANEIRTLPVLMPGNNIRRTAGPCPAGYLYATLQDNHVLFRFDPAEPAVETILEIGSDTPGMTMSPDGRFVYIVPGGKGSAGAPLIQVDTATGAQKVIAFLRAAVQEQTGFYLGGTYNVMISRDGTTVYVGFNGTQDRERNFGDQAFVAVRVPESERR